METSKRKESPKGAPRVELQKDLQAKAGSPQPPGAFASLCCFQKVDCTFAQQKSLKGLTCFLVVQAIQKG